MTHAHHESCVAYDSGLHLRGTQIWFDSDRKRKLCLVTSLGTRLPPRHLRACAPEAVAAALQSCGYKGTLLPAQSDQWIGLGGKQLQFIADGAVLVLHGTEKLLVAGHVRRPLVSWPKAHHVVASLPAIGLRGSTLPRVQKGLQLFLQQATRDQRPAHVVIDSVAVGMLLAPALALRPVGILRDLVDGTSARGTPTIGVPGARGVAPEARIAAVDTGVAELSSRPDATFRLAWWADVAAVRHLMRTTGAQVLTAIGVPAPHRDRLCQALRMPVQFLGPQTQLSF